jgi:NADH-quinone oxidoreductase subunit L
VESTLCYEAIAILFLPLAAFLVQVFVGGRLWRKGDWLPTGAMGVGLAIAGKMFFVDFLGRPGGIERQLLVLIPDWLGIGSMRISFGVGVDNLTIVMLFVVTLVSFLVHLYSWGYMHGEERYSRFFAYLALFSFSMIGLVIASNLLFVYIFWELVGLCSYFLIGFYFEKKSASNAAIKAFITTRVGDVGFFLAILIIAAVAGTLEFDGIFGSVQAGVWPPGLLVFAGICLFAGASGKSAQFPLHVWLPDAMEGPTPVSALIHAATMVAAGVYLVARMFPFLAGPRYFGGDFWSSIPLLVIALVGGFTAFFAATIAFAQTDIKKVLAYSTVSQLGYMCLGLGVGSVSAGLFHLTTHAFFKALLFLCAGSVIHAVQSNEMADMGGLRKKMPITFWTFLAGTLAIAGLPFLSGFYSKEAILTQAMAVAHEKGGLYYLPFVFGMVTALMTAFYMFRLLLKTFFGEPRNHHAFEHAHESPWTMTVPLAVLGAFAVAGGGPPSLSQEWFGARVASETMVSPPVAEPILGGETISNAMHHVHGQVLVLSLVALLAGVGGALLFFSPASPLSRRQLIQPRTLLGALHTAVLNLWWVDRIYEAVFVGGIHLLRRLAGWFDNHVIDALVNLQATICLGLTWIVGKADAEGVDGAVRGISEATLIGGKKIRRVQTGLVGQYVYASVFLFAGALAVSLWIIWMTRK